MTTFDVEDDAELYHYGILRRSGRYPWGSGDNPLQRSKGLFAHIAELKEQGMTETQIAKGLGMTSTELRQAKTIARAELKAWDIAEARRLQDKGLSNVKIGEKMGRNESSVRSLLQEGQQQKLDILQTTVSMLRRNVEEREFIDIGGGQESVLGISKDKLATAVAILREEGYSKHYIKVPQIGVPGQFTTTQVLAKPGVHTRDVYANMDKIAHVKDFSPDGGKTYFVPLPPLSISSKRLDIVYAEQGGGKADGVVFVRPGVKDLSLGANKYAQVRIAIDGTHYIKGMALYKDDLPSGVDLQFNTNKKLSDVGSNKLNALKKLEDDPQMPFGSQIRNQLIVKDSKGNEKVTSAMNMVNEQGNWETWSKTLSSQFLSKQSPQLIKQQLDLTYDNRKAELDEILRVTNPAVKRRLLDAYADSADAASIHLKAAQMPRQSSHVILPIHNLKPTQVYAPTFRPGEKVILIRHPHGGKFELPELEVNNNHPTAKKLLGDTQDAIGIHPSVAERLSGADFDGDTVIVIPNTRGLIKTEPALARLKTFDAKVEYKGYEGMKKMSSDGTQHQMGDISNLITDMTIRGANNSEIARAVRHSMVVIDAEKHGLDYRRSAIDHGIRSLKEKYQPNPRGDSRGGASTLISKSGVNSVKRVPKRKPRPVSEGGPIDPKTGRKMFVETGETYVNRSGQTVKSMVKVPRLSLVDDAHTLSSGTVPERIYADHSNRMKDLANQARLQRLRTKSIPYSQSANRVYRPEVDRLTAALHEAYKNRPLERQAQIIANAEVAARRRDNPHMDDDDLRKVKSQALNAARNRTGANKPLITFSHKEWEAVQAGAISNNRLTEILKHADLESVKEMATPRTKLLMSSSKTALAKSMAARGYTQAEIADHLGVSLTTLKTGLKGG